MQGVIIRRAARSDFICGLTLASAAVVAMATVLWHWYPNPPPPAPAVASPALAVVLPVTLAEQEHRPPLHIRNPFDATELFEFPANTGKTEAREAIAELLLQRARERRSQGLYIKPASYPPAARGVAERSRRKVQVHPRPEVFVTKLSGYPNPDSSVGGVAIEPNAARLFGDLKTAPTGGVPSRAFAGKRRLRVDETVAQASGRGPSDPRAHRQQEEPGDAL